MIKLDLKSINLYDIDFEKFTPEIPDNFHRWIDLDIGIEGEQGSSIFSLCICSPKWISHHCNKEGFFWSNALILEQFDHKIIKSEIDKILEYCSKETWDLTLSNLLRFFFLGIRRLQSKHIRAIWDDKSGAIVIRDPNSKDGGTAFRPTLGKTYFDKQK